MSESDQLEIYESVTQHKAHELWREVVSRLLQKTDDDLNTSDANRIHGK